LDHTEIYPSSSKINNPVHTTEKLINNSQLAKEYIDNNYVVIIEDGDGNADPKSIKDFSVEDYRRLIELIEDCRPIWDHKMNLTDRTDTIKEHSWNKIFNQFKGILLRIK